MKKLVLAFIALLVMGGGGTGTYFYFKQPAQAAGVKDEVQEEHKSANKGKSGGHGENAYELVYVELDPLILPIIDEYGVSQTVSLVVSLEVATDEDAAYIRQLAPRLNDALLMDMYGILNHHAMVKDGVIQVKILKKRMKHVSTKVLGEDMVSDVLMQVITQRPI